MKLVGVAGLLIAMGLSLAGAYYYLTASPLEPKAGQGNVVVIEMTTKQWRFDVLSVSPPGSAKFSTNSPTGQFADTEINVRKGDTVVLRIKNLDVPHGFALEEYGINTVTPPGEPTEVRFVASRAGSFTFFCTVFCGTGHPKHKGTLIVDS